MRDSGTESESTFTSYLPTLESKLSLSLRFTCRWMNVVKRRSSVVKGSNCSVGGWDGSCRGGMFPTGDFRIKHHCDTSQVPASPASAPQQRSPQRVDTTTLEWWDASPGKEANLLLSKCCCGACIFSAATDRLLQQLHTHTYTHTFNIKRFKIYCMDSIYDGFWIGITSNIQKESTHDPDTIAAAPNLCCSMNQFNMRQYFQGWSDHHENYCFFKNVRINVCQKQAIDGHRHQVTCWPWGLGTAEKYTNYESALTKSNNYSFC